MRVTFFCGEVGGWGHCTRPSPTHHEGDLFLRRSWGGGGGGIAQVHHQLTVIVCIRFWWRSGLAKVLNALRDFFGPVLRVFRACFGCLEVQILRKAVSKQCSLPKRTFAPAGGVLRQGVEGELGARGVEEGVIVSRLT